MKVLFGKGGLMVRTSNSETCLFPANVNWVCKRFRWDGYSAIIIIILRIGFSWRAVS